MLPKVALMLGAVLSATSIAMGCGESPPREEAAAEIVAFDSPEESIESGSPASVSVHVRNTASEAHTFFIGYSVQDVAGGWHDAPPSPVELEPGEESGARELSTEPLETPGYYNSRISVWSEEPGYGSEAELLVDFEEASTFRVSSSREDFDASELDSSRWEATSRELGWGGSCRRTWGLRMGCSA